MAKTHPAPWVIFLQGIAMSLGLYLLFQLLLASLLVKSVLAEGQCFPVLAVGCGLCVLLGGAYCARRSQLGTLSSSLIVTAGFAAILLAVGILCYEGITGRGGVLLLSALLGGILAGLLGGKRKARRKKKH